MSDIVPSLTPEQQELKDKYLAIHKQTAFGPSLPQLKFAQEQIGDIEPGNYYVSKYDSDLKKSITMNIGPNPEIVILHKCVTYSYYDTETNSALRWTSDIQGYGDRDLVTLYNKGEKGREVEFQGTWREFKDYKTATYERENPVTKRKESDLSFATILYALYAGEVHRLILKNSAVAGIPEGERAPSFQKPQKLSLTHFLDLAEINPGDNLYVKAVCALGSRFIADTQDDDKKKPKPFYIMQFNYVGTNPNLGEDLEKLDKFYRPYMQALMQENMSHSSNAKTAIAAPVQTQHEIVDAVVQDFEGVPHVDAI